MLKKTVLMTALVSLVVPLALQAAPRRARFTYENRQPHINQLELGASLGFVETVDRLEGQVTNDANLWGLTPYARYGLSDELTFDLEVPVQQFDPDMGDSASGLGDVRLGLQLKAFEGLFDVPYIIPHLGVSLPSGDEDKGLGSGETEVTVGCSVGTTVYDTLHWVGDVSYQINEDAENIVDVALSLIWDVSTQFSMSAEVSVTDEEVAPDLDNPVTILGGMQYNVSEALQIGWYGGGALDSDEDVIAIIKTAYNF